MKLIIDNRSSLTDAEALTRCLAVINMGKVSVSQHGKQYCDHSNFEDCYVDVFKRTKSGTETFVITRNQLA